MTVKELIEALKGYPEDAVVVNEYTSVEVTDVYIDSDKQIVID